MGLLTRPWPAMVAPMRTEPLLPRPLLASLALLALVVLLGVAGYHWVEGYAWFDALYMTMTVITTVGGGELRPLSPPGRVLTVVLLVVGIGGASYTLLSMVRYIIEGQLGRAVGTRAMRRKVGRMKDHFVLCGFGRVGSEIARLFAAHGMPFVIIEVDQQRLERAARQGYAVVPGNAADVEVLREAGIERARGLVAAVGNDADNVYVTISARVLRPELYIVSRANEPDSEQRLQLAGADHIVSPYTAGARLMAAMALKPGSAKEVEQLEAELGA
jgi:voltage-gated potassium channel